MRVMIQNWEKRSKIVAIVLFYVLFKPRALYRKYVYVHFHMDQIAKYFVITLI